jgi:hypothetical protein
VRVDTLIARVPVPVVELPQDHGVHGSGNQKDSGPGHASGGKPDCAPPSPRGRADPRGCRPCDG